MIIAIDGPTASGKSTVARALAEQLNMYYVSTGLLYRALAYLLTHDFGYPESALAQPNMDDVRRCLKEGDFVYDYRHDQGALLYFKGTDITPFLKTKQIDYGASIVSANEAVRHELLQYQRAFAQRHHIVMEGRDIGSIIFPQADVKFFVTATESVRAQRWQRDQEKKGNRYSLEESVQAIRSRDERDTKRKTSPLVVAPGATVIDTTLLTKEETLQALVNIVQRSAHAPLKF